MAHLSDELRDQLRRTCEELREAVKRCPGEHWRQAPSESHAPARQALHLLQTIAFYCRDTPEGFDWHEQLDWEGAPAEALPDQATLLTCLAETAGAADLWLAGWTDDQLLGEPNPFPWTGASTAGRMVYLIRHQQHHFALINAELRRAGLEPADWK